MVEPRIGVIGMGPVGSVLAGHLIRAGNAVTVIDTFRDHLSKMREDGLHLEGAGEFSVPIARSFYDLAFARDKGERYDIIFICLKATVVSHIAEQIPEVLAKGGVVVCFQNGLDTEAAVLDLLGPDKTLRAVINYAGNLAGLAKIRMTFFHPPNYLGAASPGNPAAEEQAKRIAALISNAGLTTEFAEDVKIYVWQKVIRNAALMPISALTGMDMAQVMGSDHSLHLVEMLLQEAMTVSEKVGYQFKRSFYEQTLDYYRKGGNHIPSMLGDVMDGRRTEIEFLNHKIAEYGETLGIPTPYNRTVANLLFSVDELTSQRQRKTE